MRLLQRYIFFELLRVFLSLVSVCTVLLVFVGLFREASERGLGPYQIFQILPFVAPSMLPFTIPATLLLTVCVVYGRIAGDQEVTAAKAAGISVMSLLSPAFLLGAILTVGAFTLTNHVIPWAVNNIETVIAQAVEEIFLDVLDSHHQISNAEHGYSITVTRVEGRKLVNPIFKYVINKRQQATLIAREAVLDFDLEKKEVVLHVTDALLTIPGDAIETHLASHAITFPLPSEMRKRKPRHLNVIEIRKQIAEAQQKRAEAEMMHDWTVATSLALGDFRRLQSQALDDHRRTVKVQQRSERKLRTEIHGRFAMAGSCFLFVFLGGPFSILQARRQFLTSFILCFVPILLLYYPILFLMMNLSKAGMVEPWWAMWVANVVLGSAAWLILRKVVRY